MRFTDLCLLITCGRCGAATDEWCRSRTGRRASYVHQARSWPTQQVWIEGFHEGQADAVHALDSGSEWSKRYLNDIRSRSAS